MLKRAVFVPVIALICLVFATGIWADGVDKNEAAAFHKAAALTENYNSFEATVVSAMSAQEGSVDAGRQVHLQVSGLKESGKLQVAIEAETKGIDNSTWYQNGYYYSTNNGKKIKEQMSEADMKNLLNGYLLMDLGETDFKALSSEKSSSGDVTYYFTLQEKSLEKYLTSLASSMGSTGDISIQSAIGTMDVDSDGKITSRTMNISVTNTLNGAASSYKVSTTARFPRTSQVVVSFPSDLDQYQTNSNPNIESSGEVAMSGTMYVVGDQVNLRAAATSQSNSLALLGNGTPATVIGYISGWMHVNTVGMNGYVYEKYLSWTAPAQPVPEVNYVQCPDCGGWFEEGNVYRNHICPGRYYGDDDMVLCPYCNQWYEAGNVYRNHICPARDAALSQDDYDYDDYDYDYEDDYDDDLVQCPFCGGWYEAGNEFRNHICPARDAYNNGYYDYYNNYYYDGFDDDYYYDYYYDDYYENDY